MSAPAAIRRCLRLAPRVLRRADHSRPLSLRANFLWSLFGIGVYGASQFTMLIVLAKLGTPEMVGRYALALALCAPVVMFTNLRLSAVQATDARNEYDFGDYLALRIVGSAFAIGLIAALAVLFGYGLDVFIVVLIIAVAKAVESLSDIIYGRLQKHERLDLVAISSMLRGPLALGAFAVLIALTKSVAWGVVGILGAWTLVLLTFDAFNARRFAAREAKAERVPREHHRFRAMRRLAWLALPLGFVGLLDSLNVNVPRLLIERSLGEASLGYFAAMASFIVAGNMVMGALSQSTTPRLSRAYLHDLPEFKRLLGKLLQFASALAAGGLLVAVFFGRPFLAVVYEPEYAAYANVFAWLMAAAGFGYIARFLVSSMTAARYLKAQAPLYAVTLTTLSGLCVVLVPKYELLGAAWAICAGMLTLLLGAAAVNVHAIRTRSRLLPEVIESSDPRQGVG